jgi:signal transduction histidine kinase/ActR/RegA family two-component response regulator
MNTRSRLAGLLLLWGATALLLAAIVAMAVGALVGGRRAALESGGALLSQVVTAGEAELNRSLTTVDLALAGLPDLLRPAMHGGRLDPDHAHQLLAGLQDRSLLFVDLTLVTVDGRPYTASLSASRRTAAVLAPEVLAPVLVQPVPTLVVSDPVIGRASGERSLLLMRPLVLPGMPALVAVAEVPSALLLSVASSSTARTGLLLTLERDDGLVLVTQPPEDRLIGRHARVDPGPLRPDGRPVRRDGRHTGERVIEAARPTLYPRLFITASLPQERVLAEWHDRSGVVVGIAVAAALLLLAAAAGGHWQWQRLVDAREQAALASERMDLALASMGDAFLICDAEDRVVRWNARYLELFPWLRTVLAPGVPFARLAEEAAKAMAPDDDDAARHAWIRQRMELHRQCDKPWEQVLETGVAVHAVERRMPDGGIVGVYRDMTANERQLTRAKQAAEAANEAKSRFIANMSHEIRTPLNAVLGFNQLLLASPLEPGQRRHAELVRSSGQLLLALISDLLDIARIDAGHFELQAADFDPRQLLEEVRALLQERADERALDLQVHAAADLPVRLRGDALRLRQILFNLVGNALKFTDAGHVQVRLTRASGLGPHALRLEVEDTGIGIPASALPTLFDRFTQADATAARRHGGSGLGLAITHDLVHRMGGDITVRSLPGRGSLFSVTLPCEAPQGDTATTDRLPTAAPRSPDGAPRRLEVLVAEDNLVNQMLTEAMLRQLGHGVRVVDSGRAALEQVRAQPWDLVLMDMQMPDLDGLSATRAIRALGGAAARVPIAAMTANARPEDRAACLQAGMDDFIAKPIDLDALAALLDRAVARTGPSIARSSDAVRLPVHDRA